MSRLRRANDDLGGIDAKRPRLNQDVDVGTSNNEIVLPQLSYNPADWLAKTSIPSPTNQGEGDFMILDDDMECSPNKSEVKEQTVTFDFIDELLSSPLSDWLIDSTPIQCQFSVEMSYFKEASQDIKSWLIDYEGKTEGDKDEGDGPSCPKSVCACVASEKTPQI